MARVRASARSIPVAARWAVQSFIVAVVLGVAWVASGGSQAPALINWVRRAPLAGAAEGAVEGTGRWAGNLYEAQRAKQAAFCAGLSSLEVLPEKVAYRWVATDSGAEQAQDGAFFQLVRRKLVLNHRLGRKELQVYVQEKNDIVSNFISRDGKWESKDVELTIDLMESFAKERGLRHNEAVFMDVGAQLGTFSLLVGAHGFSVLAFEPMRANLLALRLSLCANPELLEHVTIIDKARAIPMALGDQAQLCRIASPTDNVAVGYVFCGDESGGSGFVDRQDLEVETLDRLAPSLLPRLEGRLGMLKVDVEGIEQKVFKGGADLFFKAARPPTAVVEINPTAVSLHPDMTVSGLLEMVYKIGYDIHSNGLNGPVVTPDAFAGFKANNPDNNYWLSVRDDAP